MKVNLIWFHIKTRWQRSPISRFHAFPSTLWSFTSAGWYFENVCLIRIKFESMWTFVFILIQKKWILLLFTPMVFRILGTGVLKAVLFSPQTRHLCPRVFYWSPAPCPSCWPSSCRTVRGSSCTTSRLSRTTSRWALLHWPQERRQQASCLRFALLSASLSVS